MTIAEIAARQVASGEFTAEEKRLLGQYSPGTVMRTGRYERTRPDGTVLTVTTKLLLDGGFVRTCTGVTEERRIRAELETARAAAEGASLANARLIASLAEELRAKLKTILGLSETLHADAASAEAQASASAIIQASRDLLALVDSKAASVGTPTIPPA